jgi:hypothetical protein
VTSTNTNTKRTGTMTAEAFRALVEPLFADDAKALLYKVRRANVDRGTVYRQPIVLKATSRSSIARLLGLATRLDDAAFWRSPACITSLLTVRAYQRAIDRGEPEFSRLRFVPMGRAPIVIPQTADDAVALYEWTLGLTNSQVCASEAQKVRQAMVKKAEEAKTMIGARMAAVRATLEGAAALDPQTWTYEFPVAKGRRNDTAVYVQVVEHRSDGQTFTPDSVRVDARLILVCDGDEQAREGDIATESGGFLRTVYVVGDRPERSWDKDTRPEYPSLPAAIQHATIEAKALAGERRERYAAEQRTAQATLEEADSDA